MRTRRKLERETQNAISDEGQRKRGTRTHPNLDSRAHTLIVAIESLVFKFRDGTL